MHRIGVHLIKSRLTDSLHAVCHEPGCCSFHVCVCVRACVCVEGGGKGEGQEYVYSRDSECIG